MLKKFISILSSLFILCVSFSACGGGMKLSDSETFKYKGNSIKSKLVESVPDIEFDSIPIEQPDDGSTINISGYNEGNIYYHTSSTDGNIKIFAYDTAASTSKLVSDLGVCDFDIELYTTSEGLYMVSGELDENEDIVRKISFSDYDSYEFTDVSDKIPNVDFDVLFADDLIAYIGADADQALECYIPSIGETKKYIPENGISAGHSPVIDGDKIYCITFDNDRYYINRYTPSTEEAISYTLPTELKLNSYSAHGRYIVANTSDDGIIYTFIIDTEEGVIRNLLLNETEAISYFFYDNENLIIRAKDGNIYFYNIINGSYSDITGILGFENGEANTYFISNKDGTLINSFDGSKNIIIKTY